MTRLIDTDSWANAPIKKLLNHAKMIVDAEVVNCPIFDPSVATTKTVNKTTEAQHTAFVGAIKPKGLVSEGDTDEGRVTATILNNAQSDRIPQFDPDEIKIGRVVGRGGFCVVSEVREIRLMNHQRRRSSKSKSSDRSSSESKKLYVWGRRMGTPDSPMDNSQNTTGTMISEAIGQRAQLARDVWSKPGGRLVMKQVNRDLIDTDRNTFLKGIIDLAMEAKFLANLNHTNIIFLRGERSQSPFDGTGYFILLEYLPKTLPNLLNEWMHVHRATKGITGICTSFGTAGNKKKISRLMTDRLLIAYDIADVGNYLHEKNVIYRDFKPDNVGFTSQGVTKLMDFGLARELTNVDKDENGLYLLTGLTGGIRYMAPEVGLNRPYNTNADIYSWSMIFWYILSLDPPLCLYTPEMIVHRVFEKGHRPATKETWNPTFTVLLRRCWTENLHDRPTFKDIMKELHGVVRSYDKNVSALMKCTSKGEHPISL